MKTIPLSLIAVFATASLVAEPTVRDQVTEVLAHSDQKTSPPPTAKEMSQRLPPKRDLSIADPVVTLPDYEVVAPRVIPNQARIELDLAKNQVAVRQEEAQFKATEADKGLNPGSCSYEIGPASFSFGYDSAGERAAMARDRLKVLDLDQTVILTSLASTEEDAKDLERLMAKLKGPTAPAYMKRQ